MTDASILKGLKIGDQNALTYVYLEHKKSFIAFAAKYGVTNNEALDVYQDTILALRENVATGKITKLNSSLKTYLFSIGKYMIFDLLRKANKIRPIETEDFNHDLLPNDFEPLFKEALNEKEVKLKVAFKKLGEKCRSVLTLFYYQDYSIEEITKALKYSSKDVVKSQKSRCLKSLKEKMENGG